MFRYLMGVIFLVGSALAIAQSDIATNDVQLLRAAGEASRQATMTANVEFDSTQAEAFWPLYRDYRSQVSKLNDRTEALLKQFATEYGTLDDKQATKLVEEYLDIDADRVKLKKKYHKKFTKVLPGVKAARVVQIENKLDDVIFAELSDAIPLVLSPQ